MPQKILEYNISHEMKFFDTQKQTNVGTQNKINLKKSTILYILLKRILVVKRA